MLPLTSSRRRSKEEGYYNSLSRRFKFERDLLKHKKIFHNKEKHHCFECQVIFSSSFILKKHIWNEHQSEKTLECETCGKKFQPKHLKAHVESVHEGKRNHECTICGNKFYRPNQLKVHVESVHEGKRDHECTICGYKYYKPNQLKAHVESVHEGKRDHECSICGKKFYQPNNLKVHVECVHEGKKDHKCTICGKRFGQSSKLKFHIKCVHEKKKDHECTICGKNFFLLCDLRKHINRFHEGKKDPRCEYCGKVYSQINDLNDHVKKVHSNVEEARNIDPEEIRESCSFEFENIWSRKEIKSEEIIEKSNKIVPQKLITKIKTKVKEEKEKHLVCEFLKSNPETMIKKEVIEEMPIFESDSTYMSKNIKQEIKLEPMERKIYKVETM